MSELGLTGRTRFRTQNRFFRTPLLVMQVEETIWIDDHYDPYDIGQRITRWRDALPEDMLNHALVIKSSLAIDRDTTRADCGRGFPGTTF